MKVICDRAALVEALSLIGGVIASRTPKPVLLCVKIVASDGTLSLAATDLEIGLQLTSEKVEIQEEGEALIPADKLIQICRESNDPTLSIEVKNDEAKIRGVDSRFTVYGYAVSEFPPIGDAADSDPDFVIDASEFRLLIHRTLFATARENSRYAINGVLLGRTAKKIHMVATDGRRLAIARGTASSAADGDATCIIPTKALNLLVKLMSGVEDPVTVHVRDNQIIFVVGDEGRRAILTSNLVEGSFPPYEDVIPSDLDKKVNFGVEALSSAVRRAALLTNEESKGVRMSFDPEGQLTIRSRAPELGEAEINVPIEAYAGDALEIGFNPNFITDALKVIETAEVTLELKAPNKPGMIKSGGEFVYILMPVTLN